jgi:L-amino acid N-acyltransferase YncA
VIDALTREAASLGANVVSGAVMADSKASLGLFGRLGYERSHQYRYLVR